MNRFTHPTALLVFGLIVVVTVVAAIPVVFGPKEPTYNGKSLSYWMDELQRGNRIRAEEALQRIGPQAEPWLAKRIAGDNSSLPRVYRTVYEKLPPPVRRWFTPPKPVEEWFVWRVIPVFGPKAKAALPQLRQLLIHPNSNIRSEAAFALWRITADPRYLAFLLQALPKSDLIYRLSLVGAAGVPGLECALAASNAPVREVAIRGLAFIGEKAGTAAPAIAKLLNDPDRDVRVATVGCLRQIGPDRRLAVPALVRALQNPVNDDEIKEGIAEILGLIGMEARSAEPELQALVNDTNRGVPAREQAAAALWLVSRNTNGLGFLLTELEECSRSWVEMGGQAPDGNLPGTLTRAVRILNRIRDMGLSAKPAATTILNLIRNPALASSFKAERTKLLIELIDAIAAVGANPDMEVPAMVQVLRDSDPDIRLKAAIELVRLGPQSRPAVPELTAALQDGGNGSIPGSSAHYLTLSAAEALGKIGPEARTAVPALGNLLLLTNSEVRLEASIALWRITDPTNLLTRALQTFESASDKQVQIRMVELFGEIGPAASGAIPLVLRKMTYLPGAVSKALQKIDPDGLARLNGPSK